MVVGIARLVSYACHFQIDSSSFISNHSLMSSCLSHQHSTCIAIKQMGLEGAGTASRQGGIASRAVGTANPADGIINPADGIANPAGVAGIVGQR